MWKRMEVTGTSIPLSILFQTCPYQFTNRKLEPQLVNISILLWTSVWTVQTLFNRLGLKYFFLFFFSLHQTWSLLLSDYHPVHRLFFFFFLEQESFNVYIMEMFHSSAVDDITIIPKINFLYLKEKIRTNEFTACMPLGKSGNKKYIAWMISLNIFTVF